MCTASHLHVYRTQCQHEEGVVIKVEAGAEERGGVQQAVRDVHLRGSVEDRVGSVNSGAVPHSVPAATAAAAAAAAVDNPPAADTAPAAAVAASAAAAAAAAAAPTAGLGLLLALA